jgi:hypothetical protein
MTVTETHARSYLYCHQSRLPDGGFGGCLGSDCMAWRWEPLTCSPEWTAAVRKHAEATDDKAPFAKSSRHVNENRAEFGLPDRPFRGYCGLAGKPEA